MYSVAGISHSTYLADGHVYDPVAGTWSDIAPLPEPREKPAGAFIGGKMYVTGGWAPGGKTIVAPVEVYDPATDQWDTRAESPQPTAASGSAVLDRKLYTVGGCPAGYCGSETVLAYDPLTDTWTKKADFPEAVFRPSCGTIGGKLYCAGGLIPGAQNRQIPIAHTYSYDPAIDKWTQVATMPMTLGGAHTAANGRLLVSGGSDGANLTNVGYQYDPEADSWSPLPNANQIVYKSGSACGLYRIGGSTGDNEGTTIAEQLPGYDSCGNGVEWLSVDEEEFTLDPGATHTVTVTMDTANVAQPGTYTTSVGVGTNRGDVVDPVKVTLAVKAPATWGKVAGTITTADCAPSGAKPLEQAVITLTAKGVHRVVKTAKDGTYALWIGEHEGPLSVTAAKDDWRARTADVQLAAGSTRTVPLALRPYPFCPAA